MSRAAAIQHDGVTGQGQPEQPELLAAGSVRLADGMVPLSGRQVGLVPGAEVPLLEIDLPDRLRGFAREQVGFRKLRDGLGQGQLELHPFALATDGGGWRRVLAADAGAAARWRALAGTGGRAVLPDYLALPVAPALWVLALAGEGTVMARLGPGDGFSAPRDVAARQVQAALAAGPKPKAVLMPQVTPEMETLFVAAGVPVVTEASALADHGVAAPACFAHGELALDLRRDPGAARVALARRVLPWRWPVAMGLLAAGLWAGAQLLAINRLETQERALRADTLARVRADFVPAGPILDIRTQVSRALAAARAAAAGGDEIASPLDLMARTTEVLHAQGAQARSLAYSPSDGLGAVVLVADFAAAEALAGGLRAAGLGVRLIEARVEDGAGEVRAELRLTLDEEGG